MELKSRFTVCVVNVNKEYEPLYEPPHDKVGFEVGVGVGDAISVVVVSADEALTSETGAMSIITIIIEIHTTITTWA